MENVLFMKRILFPTDFSEASTNALEYALRLGKAMNAEVVVLHVYEMPVVDYVNTPAYLLDVYNTVELSTFENFKSQLPYLMNYAREKGLEDVPISSVLLEGELVATVVEMVKTDHYDLIVMSTKGATGLKETFIGTSTANIMTKTKAMVLGIPEFSHFDGIRKIVFTTRFEPADLVVLKRLLKLADAFNAQVDCLYVQHSSEEIQDVIWADWRLQLKDHSVNFHILNSDEVEQSILDYLDRHQVDMLALLNHKRGFFEGLFHTSMTKKLAFHAKIPVLVLHE